MNLNYCVIGAGNGGMAMAGYLAMIGYSVNMYNRTLEHIFPLMRDPTISITGAETGVGKLKIVTNKIKAAIENVDIIMVTVPAMGHYDIAKEMAPYLKDNQIVVLNPGRTGGALELYGALRKYGCEKDITVSEAQTFIYACRATSPNSAHIFKVKKEVTLSSIPSNKTSHVIKLLNRAYPQFTPATDVLETSINNYGAIFHPAPTLLNSGIIERGAPFEYYTEGITPTIGKILEKMDAERMKIGRRLKVDTLSAKDWLYESYGAKGRNLYETIQNNPAYRGLGSPIGLNTRYIHEDVPYSLVPMVSIARELNIPTPTIDLIIGLSGLLTGKDFYLTGRNISKLGLEGFSVDEMHEIAKTGKAPQGDREVVA
jgi:opine dehydrogenase